MQNDKPNINKEFTVAQQAEEAQKRRAEEERQTRISQVRDEAEREKLERMVRMRDNELKKTAEAKTIDQQKERQDEVQKRLDAQRAPSLDHPTYKTDLGKSPQDVAAEVEAAFKEKHAGEHAAFMDGQEQVLNKIIDGKTNAAWDRQIEQDRQSHTEQSFEKSAEQSPSSSKDAFQTAHDQTGGEKDWRSLKADRENDQSNEPER